VALTSHLSRLSGAFAQPPPRLGQRGTNIDVDIRGGGLQSGLECGTEWLEHTPSECWSRGEGDGSSSPLRAFPSEHSAPTTLLTFQLSAAPPVVLLRRVSIAVEKSEAEQYSTVSDGVSGVDGVGWKGVEGGAD
jgi:hypothetical protein